MAVAVVQGDGGVVTGWDIKPQGVQGQLQLTGGRGAELHKALSAMVADLAEAAKWAGTAVPGSAANIPAHGPTASGKPLSVKASGPVAAALSTYANKRGKDFSKMAERIEAAILGAAKATNEYVEGDLEAAKEAQDAARQVRLDLLRGAGGKK